MNELEKLLELLEKESLSQEESELLNQILDNNAEAKNLKTVYTGIKKALTKNGHIDEELMGKYVLYLNKNSSDKTASYLSARIENHLRSCSECEKLFKEFYSEYADIDLFVEQSLTDKAEKSEISLKPAMQLTRKSPTLKYFFVTVSTVLLIYFGLYLSDSILTPDYKRSFFNGEELYVTRGRNSEDFQKGLNFIDNKDYENAIKYLKADIETQSNSETLFYAYYVLGLTYISKAETDLLGLFPSYKREDVLEGINSLKKSVELNNSQTFENVKLDAYYFIGKAYLLINEPALAKDNLNIVVDRKGGFYKQAEDLLKQMNN